MLTRHTVKPEHSGHPWDPKKLAVVNRWPLFGGSKKMPFLMSDINNYDAIKI
jgi:hypothetical protein